MSKLKETFHVQLLKLIFFYTGGNNEPHDLEEEEKEVLPYEVPFCGDIDPESVCSIECYQDPDCQTLGYNLTAFPCKCAAQVTFNFFVRSSLPSTDLKTGLRFVQISSCMVQ